jgi:hypothetical protein
MLRRVNVEQNALTGSPISAAQRDIVSRRSDLAELLQMTNKSAASHGSALEQTLRTLPSHHHRLRQPCAVEIQVQSSPGWDWLQFFW